MPKTQIGQCALCGQRKELQLSHIIPKFVGRKLKSPSGNIRSTQQPNKVSQDIEKHFLLCHDCEELFSAKERWFSNAIFSPYQDHCKIEFDYDESLTYFIISLSWRSLYLDLKEFSSNPKFNQDILGTLLYSEKIMRDYLLGKRKDIGTIENHVFFLDRIQSIQGFDLSQHPSIAMHRSISSYTAYDGRTSFTISNLMGILVVTFYSMDANEHWVNTKIELENGTIKAKNQGMTSIVGKEIQHWMNEMNGAQKILSEKQQKKIQEKLLTLGDDIKKSPIFQDWIDDTTFK